MSKNYTKDLIKKEFMKLLDEKTLDNITVTELAQKCQIERKTFYYHYENLPQLIKEIFDEELERVIEEFNETLSWEESFILAAKFILDNEKAIRHMYQSDYKADVEKYVFSMAGEVISKYVSHISNETRAKDIDINLISYFYQCALSSALIQWIATNMKTDPVVTTNRLGKLMDGNILLSLKRSEKLETFTQNTLIE
ncbi:MULTISPECIES: TetR/AcrR family transcriptional regulator C-terminal domain-containing protein [Peptoniphilus]|uniref:TetR/AcrR family transcriptional regulator C-terminal domain-containing protein n=2 Tax=Peptoniphilaceae TaxID=1570339 RepID=UPI002903C37C|nr:MULTISPECIES: TetR/AcrR family transcriptional regulator C-terminal domain-containing protein [Peptoniphilus]MDU1044450.1 TetR/AcrR family transcriptional regulator C-terminal domain-containing protein [Peptoniphilus rhinitidis]MDU7303288.1 TetR/AcrR family transcriptional regulator C-terminal domain-containing protein [Peptoniphilus lacydonensis]